MPNEADYSAGFYQRYAHEYAEVTDALLQSNYTDSTHPAMRNDSDKMERLEELIAPGSKGLDAGCGPGARDLYLLWTRGYDMVGVDALEESSEVTRELHPEIADRVAVADLREPLPFEDESFDFVLSNSVIQHIDTETTFDVTIPEMARVIRRGGLLQLMFKVGSGVETIFDKDYGENRSFQLYEPDEIVERLAGLNMEVIPAEGEKLGGVILFTDPKPMRHCLIYFRRTG